MGLQVTSGNMQAHIFLLLLIAGPIVASDVTEKCELVAVPMCMTQKTAQDNSWKYNQTIFPNFLSHKDQREALTALSVFLPLLKVGCSDSLLEFLCSVHVPHCISAKPILPNPSVCKEAREDCKTVMEKFGFLWPEYLNCDRFTKDGERSRSITIGTAAQSPAHTPVLMTTQTPTAERGNIILYILCSNIIPFFFFGKRRQGRTNLSLESWNLHAYGFLDLP